MEDLSSMLGKVVERITGATPGSEDVFFHFQDGSSAHFYHSQDCCEGVSVEEVIGDPEDLVGHPLLMAEEVSSDGAPNPGHESYTWTFYKFAGMNGYLTIRWLGVSNGYYSEGVSVRFSP